MSTKLNEFNKLQLKNNPEIRPGDIIKVYQKIKDGDKFRIQIFEGLVIAKKHGRGINSNITVRKVVDGVGVERIFPVNAPFIDKIEIVRSAKVRRSKLYYLRTAKGKRAKLKNKDLSVAVAPEQPKTDEAEIIVEENIEEKPVEVEVLKVSEENN